CRSDSASRRPLRSGRGRCRRPSTIVGPMQETGSGQIVKEKAIGMRAEKFSDPPFVLSDERPKALELPGQQFNSQGVRSDDGDVSGQGLGFLDQCQALEDFLFLAAVMSVEELTQLAWRDFLELC